MIYTIGQKFSLKSIFLSRREKYILAQPLPNQACLISLNDGNRWRDPIKVKKVKTITAQEFQAICGEAVENIRLVKK